MCECQPGAVVLAEFEPALFQRYDLVVEFVRRRRLARRLLAERWFRLHKMADADIIDELVCVCSIEPLCLEHEHERVHVETVGVVGETQQPCYLYRKFIPFRGDAELWHLSPGDGGDLGASGEVVYLEYVTGVLEVSQEAALSLLNAQSDIAERVIAAQEARIVAFNKGLGDFVAGELAKRRRLEQVSCWWEHPVGSA